ncbi:MAG: A24 family peptidase [Pseudomonadota bacterium]
MPSDLFHWLSFAAAGAMLAAATWSDARYRRIPNSVVLAGCAAALALSMAPGGVGPGNALAGMATGFFALLPMYLMRVMGAGDVKLMAATGAFVGFPAAVGVVLLTLVAGGVLSIAYALYLRQSGAVFRNLRTAFILVMADIGARRLPRADSLPTVRARIPYALAIAAGAIAHTWLVNAR